jgi:hypothetical protein
MICIFLPYFSQSISAGFVVFNDDVAGVPALTFESFALEISVHYCFHVIGCRGIQVINNEARAFDDAISRSLGVWVNSNIHIAEAL